MRIPFGNAIRSITHAQFEVVTSLSGYNRCQPAQRPLFNFRVALYILIAILCTEDIVGKGIR